MKRRVFGVIFLDIVYNFAIPNYEIVFEWFIKIT